MMKIKVPTTFVDRLYVDMFRALNVRGVSIILLRVYLYQHVLYQYVLLLSVLFMLGRYYSLVYIAYHIAEMEPSFIMFSLTHPVKLSFTLVTRCTCMVTQSW
jgi:hypothetical protein